MAQNRRVNPKTFFGELKRRNIYKVAIAYGVVAWLLIQIASQVFPFFEIPNWAVRFVVLAIIIGFPIALILAWAFEVTLKASSGRKLPTQPTSARVALCGFTLSRLEQLFRLASLSSVVIPRNAKLQAKSAHARGWQAIRPFNNRSAKSR